MASARSLRFGATVTIRPSGSPRRGAPFVIVASSFHQALTQSLVAGALSTLRRAGISAHDVEVLWAPGAFELPVVASHIANSRVPPRAIIALGVLIRGQTSQYTVLAHAVAQGLTQVAVQTRVPVTCGVILAETLAQAKARAGGAFGNRGSDAAQAALDVLRLFERMKVRWD